MNDSHFESIEIAVLAVSMERPEDAFVMHLYESYHSFLQLLRESQVSRHHEDEINNLLLFLGVMRVVKGRTLFLFAIILLKATARAESLVLVSH